MVNGYDEAGSTYAVAQVSIQNAEFRIMEARKEFCELMNQINQRLMEEIPGTYNLKEVPKFNFKPLDMSGEKGLRETCKKLWENGVLSTKTMLEAHGYDVEKEKIQREKEIQDGVDQIMKARVLSGTAVDNGNVGRPRMTDEERKSDPENSETSKQSKSSVEGES